ncbi:PilN domain-containing protein [Mucilaginibacter sp. UR6-1]|uniref:PilN domain-containing protein n=1 Tax=Mucilaginibacter sp. UR6-1 TaxID=1435643 RepID=UPI001E3E135C|nr:PilN domain-containing protein [Mucilaginibacter sp. UR6-1]MCC8409355.1 PilN domain-containing protein [Mucilaginibacter sp. UR6-1]
MLERFYQIDTATGLTLHLLPDGSYIAHACSICVKGTQLDIEKKLTGKHSLKDVAKELNNGTLIALNINGKGVLTKIVELNGENVSPDFASILPGADPADYYRQDFRSGASVFISLIRRTDADRWMAQLHTMGFKVFLLSLGPFAVDQILPQLNNYSDTLIFDGHQIGLGEKNHWMSYVYQDGKKAELPFKIESERMDERLLLPYAAAFQLALHDRLAVIGVDSEEITELRNGWMQRKKLKAQAMLMLMAFFVLLLINFLVFNHFYTENLELQSRTKLIEQNAGDARQESIKIKEQEAVLQKLGYNGSKLKSVMIDQLCSLLPDGVTLTAFEINPVDQKKSRELRNTYFIDHRLKITGNADRVLNVNEWLALMGTCKWLKNAELEIYRVNPETGIGQFVITAAY